MKNTNQEKIKRILAGAGAVLLILMYISTLIFAPVSYTHLDVYKRQVYFINSQYGRKLMF